MSLHVKTDCKDCLPYVVTGEDQQQIIPHLEKWPLIFTDHKCLHMRQKSLLDYLLTSVKYICPDKPIYCIAWLNRNPFVCKGQYEAHPTKMSGHHQRPWKKEVSSFYTRPSGSFDLAGLAKTAEWGEAVRNDPTTPLHLHTILVNTGLTWDEEEEDLGLEEATAPEDWVILHWYARVGGLGRLHFYN